MEAIACQILYHESYESLSINRDIFHDNVDVFHERYHKVFEQKGKLFFNPKSK